MSRVGSCNYFPKNLETVDRQNAYWREVCAKAAAHEDIPASGAERFPDYRSPLGSFYKGGSEKLSKFFDGASGKAASLYGGAGMSAFHARALSSKRKS
jgi:hypothetical protein